MVLPTAFFRLFLDSQLNYSSGYFSERHSTLESAQRAKVAEILRQCQLEASMRLLDVGCGWGAATRTAAQVHGARAIGITVSDLQHRYAIERQRADPAGQTRAEFRLQRWEDFTQPVDRIICINSFESFTDKQRFLPHCRTLLAPGGVMVMLTVTADRGIFRVLPKSQVIASARSAGFEVDVSASLSHHYVRTLEHFIRNLQQRREEAMSLVGPGQLNRTMALYSKSAEFLRRKLNDMFEFRLVAR